MREAYRIAGSFRENNFLRIFQNDARMNFCKFQFAIEWHGATPTQTLHMLTETAECICFRMEAMHGQRLPAMMSDSCKTKA